MEETLFIYDIENLKPISKIDKASLLNPNLVLKFGKDWKKVVLEYSFEILEITSLNDGSKVLIKCIEEESKVTYKVFDLEKEKLLYESKEESVEEFFGITPIPMYTFSKNLLFLKTLKN